jgi:virginiamycin B lyase
LVTFEHSRPAHAITVYSDSSGAFLAPGIPADRAISLRVRRIGWKDHREDLAPIAKSVEVVLEVEADPSALAAQLPANHWYSLVLEQMDDRAQRREFKRQCTYCHQQGNERTRIPRDHESWQKLISLMGRRGAMLSRDLRESLPDYFIAAYDVDHAVPTLVDRIRSPDFSPPPSAGAQNAVIEEWELGGRASTQHDVVFHPNGLLYSVDGPQDRLYSLDPEILGGRRQEWPIPIGDLPLGGVLATVTTEATSTSNSHVSPHSLQVAPDGAIWITLSIGNQLARFDVTDESWTMHELDEGFYPHTLRFDQRGRIWYTLSASNHIGLLDPATGEHRQFRLPSENWQQEAILRALPFLLWLGRQMDLRSMAADSDDGVPMPIPYGIDIAPDGAAWFSQLNLNRIGRVDPDTLEITTFETPFYAPRRIRFDSKGGLWIPAYSDNLIARYEPATDSYRTWELPIEPLGSDVPYALNVDLTTDDVWVCGTNSDTLIRFEPDSEKFTVYALPTRVTYTREIVFDTQGRVWSSNSNGPMWQVEGGVPRVLRVDPAASTQTQRLSAR